MTSQAPKSQRTPSFLGDLRVDPELNEVHRGDEIVHLEPSNMDVLAFLMKRAPQVVSADELLDRFWADAVVEESTIHRRISQIRQALGDNARRPTYIATVPKRGYRVIAEVRPVAEEAASETVAETGAENAPGKDPADSTSDNPDGNLETLVETAEARNPVLPAHRLGRPSWRAVGGTLLIILGIGSWLAMQALERQPPSERAGIPATPADDAIKIAVLPFDDLSPEPTLSRMADGFQEDILTMLSKVDGLQVTSRTSVERYRDAEGSTIPQLGRELGVSHVIEGSLRRTGTQLRVSVQLIDAGDDAHLWAETYDGPLQDLFSIQSQVARSVAESLSLSLDEQNEEQIDRAPTDDLNAYELVLRARPLIATGTTVSLAQAEELLEAALGLDSNIAEAHASLAKTLISQDDRSEQWVNVRERARAAAESAVTLDPLSATALTVRAQIAARESDLGLASKLFQEALELEPNNSQALSEYASYLSTRKAQYAEALPFARRALLLDPLSADAHFTAARLLMDTGSLEEAIGIIDNGLRIDPDHSGLIEQELGVHVIRGEWLALLGRLEEMLRQDPENLWNSALVAIILRSLDPELGQPWAERLRSLSPTHSIYYETQRDIYLRQRDVLGLAELLEQYKAMNTDHEWTPSWEGVENPFGVLTEVALLTMRADEAHVSGSFEEEQALREAAVAVMADTLLGDQGQVVISSLNVQSALSHAINLRMLGQEGESQDILTAIADYPDTYNEAISGRLLALALLDADRAIEFCQSRPRHMEAWALDEIGYDRLGLFQELASDPRFAAVREQVRSLVEELRRSFNQELPELMDATVGL